MKSIVLSNIKVTPENHRQYDVDGSGFMATSMPEWQEALRVHASLNDEFHRILGNDDDWGGRYYAFLKGRLGLEPNSENGWWSVEAVNPQNIMAFYKYQTDAEFAEQLDAAIGAVEVSTQALKHVLGQVNPEGEF